MIIEASLWDLDDDPAGNVRHCLDHGVTKDEVEEVLASTVDTDISRSSGPPVVFGLTKAGRHLMVAFDEVEAGIVYPVTAYDVPRRRA